MTLPTSLGMRVKTYTALPSELSDLQQSLIDIKELTQDDGSLTLQIGADGDAFTIPSVATKALTYCLEILSEGKILMLNYSAPCFSISDVADHLGASLTDVQIMMNTGILEQSPDGRIVSASIIAKEDLLKKTFSKFTEDDCKDGAISVEEALSLDADSLFKRVDEITEKSQNSQ